MAAALRTKELAAYKSKGFEDRVGYCHENEPLEFKDGGNGYRRGSSPGFSYNPDRVFPIISSL